MTITVTLYGYYEDSTDKDGETGLTVTIDVWRRTKSDGTIAETVTGGSATEIGDGLYYYNITSADPTLYDYLGVFKTTASTVTSKHVAAIRWDAAEGWATGLATLATGVSLADGAITAAKIATDAIDADAIASDALAAIAAAINGTGAFEITNIIDDGTNPLDGVQVRCATDSAFANVIATDVSDTDGNFTFYLDAGTYYVRAQLAGYNFTDKTLTVSSGGTGVLS